LAHNEMSGAVRINLVGREPGGLVRRGVEEARLRRRLTEELLALRDPVSGRPVVEAVVDAATEFPGPERDRLPDLLAVWAREGPIVGATSPAVGAITPGPHELRPGNHVPGGFLVAAGPGVVPGPPGTASLVDVAPTVAHLLGVELAGCDGRAITSLVAR
jgi:predicted AlkP superfamily phosphohydrolase/phosphomutase